MRSPISENGGGVMKLILHAGMSKSGSTALQRGLTHLRASLLQNGIYYPEGIITPHNQSFLIAAVQPFERLPRHFRQPYEKKQNRIRKDFDAWIERMRKEIEVSNPHTLLLSGETLFKMLKPEQFDTLSGLLRSFASEVEVAVYLRRPSEFYLSSSQQALRASHRIKTIKPVAYRQVLEGFEAMADQLHVYKYDRSLFPDGDILRHFMGEFCPAFAYEDPTERLANVSLSAEGLALLARYRRLHHSHRPNRFTKDTNRLIAAIRDVDAEIPDNSRPRLKPEIAKIIDEGSEDLLWLRDRHEISFDEISYENIRRMDETRRPQTLEEICDIKKKRLNAMSLHVIRNLADKLSKTK